MPYLHTDITLQRVSSIRVPRTVVKLFMGGEGQRRGSNRTFSDPVPYLHTDITLQRVSSIRVPRTVVKLFIAKVGDAGVIGPFF